MFQGSKSGYIRWIHLLHHIYGYMHAPRQHSTKARWNTSVLETAIPVRGLGRGRSVGCGCERGKSGLRSVGSQTSAKVRRPTQNPARIRGGRTLPSLSVRMSDSARSARSKEQAKRSVVVVARRSKCKELWLGWLAMAATISRGCICMAAWLGWLQAAHAIQGTLEWTVHRGLWVV